jgi:hypothetical protein
MLDIYLTKAMKHPEDNREKVPVTWSLTKILQQEKKVQTLIVSQFKRNPFFLQKTVVEMKKQAMY